MNTQASDSKLCGKYAGGGEERKTIIAAIECRAKGGLTGKHSHSHASVNSVNTPTRQSEATFTVALFNCWPARLVIGQNLPYDPSASRLRCALTKPDCVCLRNAMTHQQNYA